MPNSFSSRRRGEKKGEFFTFMYISGEKKGGREDLSGRGAKGKRRKKKKVTICPSEGKKKKRGDPTDYIR